MSGSQKVIEGYTSQGARLGPTTANIVYRPLSFITNSASHLSICTQEKWDSMTRKWRDHKSLVQLVRLFLIDEVHQLNDESRGPTMEAIVSRMKTIHSSLSWQGRQETADGEGGSCQTQPGALRFIAISATIPNISDVSLA